MAATLVLVVFNWRGFYIGGELEGAVGQDDARFLALQFTAKLHELFINASLTTVILSYIQRKLVAEDSGLPFGAIAAGLQFRDVNYLLSKEYWGAVRASWLRPWDKTVLLVSIFVCALLAVSAGPSSATLMRPRLDYWPAGGTDFWIDLPENELYSTNASATQVAPSCMNDTGDLGCPSGAWQVLAQNYMSFYQSRRQEGYLPDYTYLPSERSVRALRSFIRTPDFQFGNDQTQATVGSSSVADGLVETGRLWAWAARNWRSYHHFHERFWSRIDVTYRVKAQQPIVHVRCKEYYASDDDSGTGFSTSASTIPVYDLSDDQPPGSDFGILEYNYADDEQVRSLIQNAFNSEPVPQVAWATVRQSKGSALGATLNVPVGDHATSKLFQCTIAAGMAPGILNGSRNNPLMVTGAEFNSIYDNDNTFPRISIDPAWAAFLNPTTTDNSTAFQDMMQAAGILDGGFAGDSGSIMYAIESLLSLSVVNGLARRDFGASFSGTLLGSPDGLDLVSYSDSGLNWSNSNWDCYKWCMHLLPSSGYEMSYGGNAFNISSAEMAASTKFTMLADAEGFAYNSRGSAAKFAMIALVVHLSIALIHLVYTTLYNTETLSSWGSVSELVALAMSSDQSERLENTGAGIDSDAIFEERTQVIDKGGRLQLAVGDPAEPYEPVEANKEYG